MRLAEGPCACGRTFARLEGGILGRLDDMLIVRGVNVFPSAIEGIVRRFPVVDEFQIGPCAPGSDPPRGHRRRPRRAAPVRSQGPPGRAALMLHEHDGRTLRRLRARQAPMLAAGALLFLLGAAYMLWSVDRLRWTPAAAERNARSIGPSPASPSWRTPPTGG